ncbi:MAG TPA: SGNH/GDSL hydrolase family protein [Gemmatimonadaceae bacterium]|nr:SGNH/GDSL hydrolase family protein [Gemmatimonadaceae bacterium]
MASRRWYLTLLQNGALALLGVLLALAAGELVLRVYNPFESRVKGYAIQLPVRQRYLIDNTSNDKLDRQIVHTTNSLGFRGAEPPADPDSVLTIMSIGGSTTECFYLSDGRTWTDALGRLLGKSFAPLWINNAGLDGQSTFGHLVLLDSIVRMRAKPRVAFYLIGINDVGNDAPTREDTTLYRRYSVQKAWRQFVTHSEILALGVDIYRYAEARRQGLVQGAAWSIESRQIDLAASERKEIAPAEEARLLAEHRDRYIPAYTSRVRELVRRSRANGIEPILITQPVLLGPVKDDVTGVQLGDIAWHGSNGAVMWKLMELYNDVLRQEALDDSVKVVDLGRELPKSSRYFYDNVHYTNEGAERVAEIIYSSACPYLAKRYPHYRSGACRAIPAPAPRRDSLSAPAVVAASRGK